VIVCQIFSYPSAFWLSGLYVVYARMSAMAEDVSHWKLGATHQLDVERMFSTHVLDRIVFCTTELTLWSTR